MTDIEKPAGNPAANGLPLSVSRKAQRDRIGDYLLRHGRATTIELRESCNALCPAARILEMRRMGWSIATVWTPTHDAQGRPHRCGLYVLTRGGARHD